MAEVAQQQQETKPISPWHRQPGEKTLWYTRFKRYRQLGPKRTLQKAFEAEQAETTVHAVPKRTETGQNTGVAVSISHVVPGSWKAASAAWDWVERAKAWDDYLVSMVADQHLQAILTGAAISTERVRLLKNLYETTGNLFNANYESMEHEQINIYIARLQSILRDIRDEMRQYDEALARDLTRRECLDVYTDATPEEIKAGVWTRKKST